MADLPILPHKHRFRQRSAVTEGPVRPGDNPTTVYCADPNCGLQGTGNTPMMAAMQVGAAMQQAVDEETCRALESHAANASAWARARRLERDELVHAVRGVGSMGHMVGEDDLRWTVNPALGPDDDEVAALRKALDQVEQSGVPVLSVNDLATFRHRDAQARAAAAVAGILNNGVTLQPPGVDRALDLSKEH